MYLSELLRFNKSLNLISASTVGRADVVHILDAARAWSLVGPCIPANSLVYDFGSGNGLPGIVAAILAPGVIFRLVDRDQRKVEFLKHVVAALALNNVSVIREDLREIRDRSVKFGISRGLASVANSLLQGRRMFESGGQFFMLKGEGWARELAEVQPQIFSDWSVEMMGQYRLPDSAADFVVLRGTRLN